jgi:diketogulonate reductase-like aldo/keto reductase
VLLAAFRPVQKGALLRNPPKIVQDMCEKYGKTPAQIALNWLVSQSPVVTIAKTSTPEHLEENLGALDFVMDGEDIERLRNKYPDQKAVSNSVPLG